MPDQSSVSEHRADRPRLKVSGLLVLFGLLMGFIALGADYLGISGQTGFGWYQRLGLLIGMALVVMGSLFRVDVMCVVGVVLLILSLTADFLHVGMSPGIGRRQQFAMGLAVATLVAGLLLSRRVHHRS